MRFYRFGVAVTRWFVSWFYRMRYEGLENIPQGGGYIVAANHLSLWDPLLIAHVVKPQIHYIAKYEVTTIPVIGYLIRRLGAIPVRRGEGDGGALDKSVALLKQGAVFGIFPEGTRSKTGLPLRARSGISVIAGRTGADVLPVGLSYSGKGFRARVTVRFGKPIPHERLGINLASPATLRGGAKQIMGEIIALLEPREGTL